MNVEHINPYNTGKEKGKEVELMFDTISRKYDYMNSIMSMGQHRRWRDKALKAAIKELNPYSEINILDVATGTGSVAFRLHDLLPGSLITGIDLSEGMLEIAREKLKELPSDQQKLLSFGKGDSTSMPFHDGEFDLITVAYGVRNFSDLKKGITEMRRVLKPGGILCIIELSTPKNPIYKLPYNLYSGYIIPFIGKRVTGDSKAYSYLPQSINACPQREDMAALLYGAGFYEVKWKSLSFGALTYYIAR